jgi:hypothetical protein
VTADVARTVIISAINYPIQHTTAEHDGRQACPRRAASVALSPVRPCTTMTSCGPGSSPASVAGSNSDARAPVDTLEGDQRPVLVRRQRREDLVELLIRHAARDPAGHPGPVEPGAPPAVELHRIAVRMGPAAIAGAGHARS